MHRRDNSCSCSSSNSHLYPSLPYSPTPFDEMMFFPYFLLEKTAGQSILIAYLCISSMEDWKD